MIRGLLKLLPGSVQMNIGTWASEAAIDANTVDERLDSFSGLPDAISKSARQVLKVSVVLVALYLIVKVVK